VLENCSEDFSTYTIYLPSYKACRYLQEIFLKKIRQKAIILPNITTLYNVDFLTENYTHSADQNIYNVATVIEEELVLTNIIHSYPRFDYSYPQALSLSKNLVGLFRELTLNEIDINLLSEIYQGDYAEHWLNIQEFLLYAKHAWSSYLKDKGKIDCATQHLILLYDKINHLGANNDQKVIIAGFKPENPALLKLYKLAAHSNNLIAVLPTLCMELVEGYWNKIESHQSLEYLKNLVEACEIQLQDIKLLKQVSNRLQTREKCLFNLFFLSKPSIRLPVEGIQGVKYLPTSNQAEESALIAIIIKYLKDYEPGSRIAVVTQNKSLVEQISIFLQRFGLEFERYGAVSLSSFKATNFLLLLFKMVEKNFTAAATLSFMKHPYFCCEEVYELEKRIFRGPEIIGGIKPVLGKLKIQQDDNTLTWFEAFVTKLTPLITLCGNTKNNFKNLLVTLIKVGEALYPNLWVKENAPVAEYLRDLLEDASLLKDVSLQEFSTLISTLFNQKTIECADNWSPKLFAVKPEEIGMISKIDYIVLADLNDDSWPRTPQVDPWMGDRMRASLGLERKSGQIIKDFQSFYNALHCREVFLTRAVKIGGAETTASRFLLKLLSKLETQGLLRYLEPDIDWYAIMKDVLFPDKAKVIEAQVCKGLVEHFPKQLAVTYIELLMRNPHAFYAKKILKLEKLEPIGAEPSAKEFGIFLHDVIEEYCNSCQAYDGDRMLEFMRIARNVISRCNINKFTENLWWPRFKKIAAEFIKYDEGKRKLGCNIHTETQGKIKISVGGKDIIITAKADRIEAGCDGTINIIDFKTGGVPTHKDIEAGLSPQLLIEYFILANGGFENIKNYKEVKLTYIKLGSTKPYLKETKLKLKLDILDLTENGLKKLLEFFLKEEVIYLSCPNKSYAPNYNDYEHLARDLVS
jgi:ATP-dependent helicase/nuclease subunit B